MIANQVRRAATRASGGGPILDNFTGTGLLSAHTADSGESWTQIDGVHTLTGSGSVYGTTFTANVAMASIDQVTPISDLTMEITGEMDNNSSAIGVMFRRLDANNHIQCDSFGRNLRLYKKVGGSLTLVQQLNSLFTLGVSYRLKIVALGSSVKVYLDDVEKMSHTITDLVTATEHGLFFVSTAPPRTGTFVEKFTLE